MNTTRYIITDWDRTFGEDLLRSFEECVEAYGDYPVLQNGWHFIEINRDTGTHTDVTDAVERAWSNERVITRDEHQCNKADNRWHAGMEAAE